MINIHSTRYPTSLFIFRRDLRLHDNNGLNHALRLSQQVIPCFILDPQQITPHPYQSKPALQFMLQSLQDLQQQLHQRGSHLALYHAAPEAVITQLVTTHRISAVFINRDYTPFSRQRDDNIANLCRQLGLALYVVPDVLLHEPEHCLKADMTPYQVFTAFYNNARQFPITPPQPLAAGVLLKITTDVQLTEFYPLMSQTLHCNGGRQAALSTLANLAAYYDYAQRRDFPSQDQTSHLSAHLKFGTCSIREAYYAVCELLSAEHPLIRQLYWRDFFTHLAYHFPRVFGQAFLSHCATLRWEDNQAAFQRWCAGTTGFPIVDAGMRQLNATGFMHNRVRMIVASFLVKDLHLDWRWGERYFAQQLVDYDPCVNNGNWQWAASTGCDAQPYFRIFNPWLQQQKFDPQGAYIYHWLPEIKGIAIKVLHQWHSQHTACAYPAPMVSHEKESRIAKEQFKQAILLYSRGDLKEIFD